MRSSLVLVLFASAAVALCACSSDKSEPENAPPGEYSVCGALNPTCSALYTSPQSTCTQAARDQCEALSATRSEAFKAAVVTCAKRVSPCVLDFQTCVDTETARAPATAAQAKAKSDFCAKCPTELNACSAFFAPNATGSADTAPPPSGGTLVGVGLPLLGVNDAVVADIASKCMDKAGATSGSDACGVLEFTSCVKDLARRAIRPAACQ